MTDKQLQKLGRRELLEMLLEQAKESERLNALLKETDEQLRTIEESYERLRDKLDRKDERIHELENTLETEREEYAAQRGQYEAERGQYAQAREQHEAQRAALLEKYTAQHEQFQAERAADCNRYEAELESVRQQHEAELEAVRQQHEAELAAQREQLEAEHEALRVRCEVEPEIIEDGEWTESEKPQLGSIAEAALEISGVFEAAQRAADYYLKRLRELYPLPPGAELPSKPDRAQEAVRRKAPAAAGQRTAVVVVKSDSDAAGRTDRRTVGQLRVKRQKGEGRKPHFLD